MKEKRRRRLARRHKRTYGPRPFEGGPYAPFDDQLYDGYLRELDREYEDLSDRGDVPVVPRPRLSLWRRLWRFITK